MRPQRARCSGSGQHTCERRSVIEPAMVSTAELRAQGFDMQRRRTATKRMTMRRTKVPKARQAEDAKLPVGFIAPHREATLLHSRTGWAGPRPHLIRITRRRRRLKHDVLPDRKARFEYRRAIGRAPSYLMELISNGLEASRFRHSVAGAASWPSASSAPFQLGDRRMLFNSGRPRIRLCA